MSETCYRYSLLLRDENERIADLLVGQLVVLLKTGYFYPKRCTTSVGAFYGGNGPEYIRLTLSEWAEKHCIALAHIQPGQRQQNA
ncbi:hypothetical protein [Pseudooceanicola spongiae]|uniref:Uncharacterized protein n=1 Tax=Pseudooceanicola spongiae TaxID=2613965 RepID=A0A7L9WKF5_9RHOB|nr:hypothetical protein F3W81_05850 [Pseudooceanicola spongiae]